MSRFAAAVSCLLVIVSTIGLAQARQAVTYFYDELGRLVGVVDPNGESAAYT